MTKKLFWLVLFLLIPSLVCAQGSRFDSVAQRTVQGFVAPIPGALITVCSAAGTGTPCTPTTPIYLDAGLTQQAPNPFTSDSAGNFGFYAPASTTYKVSITATGVTGQLITVVLPIVGGGAGTFSTVTATGTATFKNINATQYISSGNPQGWSGADPGAQINSALTSLGGPGTLQIGCGTYLVSTQIVLNQGQVITGPSPTGEGDSATQGCVILKEANGANLSPMIKSQGSQAGIVNLVVDGNKANNPTSGACVSHTFAVSGTLADRQYERDVTTQNCKGDGVEVLCTLAGGKNEAGATELDHVMLLNNDMDGLYVANCLDIWVRNGSQAENNGLGGGAYGSGYASVNTSGTSVTWVSGPKWTTDASMVGRTVAINNCRTTIASVGSTTTLTLASTSGFTNSSSCTITNQNGVSLRMGHGHELKDCLGCRAIGNDFGGNEEDGMYIYGTVAIGSSDDLIYSNQFGGNVENDIEIQGWDSVGGNYGAQSHHIAGNFFIGKQTGANWILSTYDAIYVQDSNFNQIAANFVLSNPANGYKYGIHVHETVGSREGRDGVTANHFGLTFSTAKFFSDSVIPTGFNVNQDGTSTTLLSQPVVINNDCYAGKNTTAVVECILGLNSSNQTVLQGDSGAKTIFVQANPGTTAWQFGNGFSGPVGGNPLIPNADGATTIGNSSTRFSGFWSNGAYRGAQTISDQGSACTNGELALSAGWQSTGSATVTAVAGNGQTCSWTITTGTTTAANPTVTDTLTNALPAATTVCEMNIHGGTHTPAAGEGFQQTTLSGTAPIFTFNGTPTAGGTTYFVTRRCGP